MNNMSPKFKRYLVKAAVNKITPKVKEAIVRKIKNLAAENKQLKEENEKLKELVKDMQDDIQRAKQSGYELGMRDGRNQIF